MPRRLAVLLLPSCLALLPAAAPPPPLSNSEALTPQKERATFQVPKGFRVELVACEPNVVDPVAIAFDEDGRLFVAEMRGYPNAGRATDLRDPSKPSPINTGKIKLLEDRKSTRLNSSH